MKCPVGMMSHEAFSIVYLEKSVFFKYIIRVNSGDVYVVSRSAADRLSKTNSEMMANSKIVDDDKFADLDKNLEVTFTPYQKVTRFDSSQLGVEKPSRKLPDLPTSGSAADAEMDFDG